MITDGSYGGETRDAALQEQGVNLVQTAIRGLQPYPDKFHLFDFDLHSDEQGNPATLTCSLGQTAPVMRTRTGVWQARFDPAICATCPFQQEGRWPTKPQKRDLRYLLSFTAQEVLTAKRRKEYLAHKGNGYKLRSAVEATVRSVKHPFPVGKMPVRGQFRVTCMAIASAATTNVRRIHRYLVAKTKAEQEEKTTKSEPNRPSKADKGSYLGFFWVTFIRCLGLKQALYPIFVC